MLKQLSIVVCAVLLQVQVALPTLPVLVAAKTTLPILGVPAPSKYLKGLDSLLSIVQMPKGIAVAIGEAGATNAGLFAVFLLAFSNPGLSAKLNDFRKAQADKTKAMTLPELE